MNAGLARKKEAATSVTITIAPIGERDRTPESGAAIAAAWEGLEGHFEYHAALIARFKNACQVSVKRMWESGTNEVGEPLTSFEREALVERHCELFGIWPDE